MSSDIFTNFLLTNVTVLLIQPANQGIVQNMKRYYGRDFVNSFMHCIGTRKILQSQSSKDAILSDVHA